MLRQVLTGALQAGVEFRPVLAEGRNQAFQFRFAFPDVGIDPCLMSQAESD